MCKLKILVFILLLGLIACKSRYDRHKEQKANYLSEISDLALRTNSFQIPFFEEVSKNEKYSVNSYGDSVYVINLKEVTLDDFYAIEIRVNGGGINSIDFFKP